MTKKDFIAIAAALRKVLLGIEADPEKRKLLMRRPSLKAFARCVAEIEEVCAASNPRFDRDIFLDAIFQEPIAQRSILALLEDC